MVEMVEVVRLIILGWDKINEVVKPRHCIGLSDI